MVLWRSRCCFFQPQTRHCTTEMYDIFTLVSCQFNLPFIRHTFLNHTTLFNTLSSICQYLTSLRSLDACTFRFIRSVRTLDAIAREPFLILERIIAGMRSHSGYVRMHTHCYDFTETSLVARLAG